MIDPNRFLHPTPTRVREERKSIGNEQEYHDHFAVSQSDLKKLEKSPRLFREEKLKREEEEDPYVDMSKYIKMGTMIEQNLLEPDRFEENFIEQSEMETPSSPNQKEFVDLILTGEYGMVEAHNKAYANSNPSKAAALYEDLEEYIEFQNESTGKGVYDQEERETMLKVTGDIMSHNKASDLLIGDAIWDNTWTQLPLMGIIEDVMCKGLADRIVQDGSKFYVIDLKTTSKSLYNFGYHFNRRKYYLQFSMYCALLLYHAKKEWDKDINVTAVVVASHTKEPYDTLVRTIPEFLLHQGNDELRMLLRRLKWHADSQKWDRRRDYYEDHIPELHFNKADIPGIQL